MSIFRSYYLCLQANNNYCVRAVNKIWANPEVTYHNNNIQGLNWVTLVTRTHLKCCSVSVWRLRIAQYWRFLLLHYSVNNSEYAPCHVGPVDLVLAVLRTDYDDDFSTATVLVAVTLCYTVVSVTVRSLTQISIQKPRNSIQIDPFSLLLCQPTNYYQPTIGDGYLPISDARMDHRKGTMYIGLKSECFVRNLCALSY